MSNSNCCALGRKTILSIVQNYLALAKSMRTHSFSFDRKIIRLDILFAQSLLPSSSLFRVVKQRGPWVCWSGGSVLSGTGGPNRLVWMARINKCMSRTRNHIAPVFLFGLGCIRPVDADLVPWALLTTRTTVNGPLFL